MKNLPSNVKVWGERNDVEKFMTACDVLMFNSTWECNPLVVRESINYGMKILARDLPQYMGMFDEYITPIEGDVKNISKQLVDLIESKSVYTILPDDTFGEDLFNFYSAVTHINITQNKPLTKDYTYVRHYINQPYFEVQGTTENKLNIKYYDDKNEISYQNELSINSWVKLNKEYFIKWRTTVEENGEIIYDETLNLKDKRVYISFGSKSLGDTIAWIPYCEVFRKKHGCKLIVSTFLNSLFKDQYPDIEFVEPGDSVPNIHAQYRLGWYYTSEGVYDNNKHPNDFKKIPLQKTATDILGLDYEEVRPILKLPDTPKKKKVGIGFHSTAQSKYWNNPDGWQAVIDHLNNLGYECMIYSKEGDGYMNNNYPEGVTTFNGGNLQEVIDDLSECEFFIGLGSGLSWLAWACKLPVVLISGFSEKWAETKLDTYRVINESVCHGCFNSDRLDAGDWNWCPLHKNTDRMFECTKQISSDMVIKEINKIINKEVIEEKIDEVSFDWGKKNEWYVDEAIQEIENNKLIQTMEGLDYSTVNNRCLFDDGVIVDVGCLNWDWSNFFLGKKRVVGIDPFEEQIPFTELFKGVISNYNGTTKMKFSHEASTIINQSDGETVQVRTWGHFCNEYNIKKISVLKINIEGSEYDLLDSLTDDDFNNIDQIAISFHDWMIPEWKPKTERAIKILKSKNYDIQKINNSWGWYLAVKNKSTQEKKINKIINKEVIEEKIDEVSFDWGSQTEWYKQTITSEIFEDRIYERFFEVEEGDIVLDIGASLGSFTYSIIPKNPKHVFCFEPCEEEFPTLVKNTIGYPVTHIMKGISDVNTIVDNTKLFNSVRGTQTRMESITFKKFIKLYGINKIDFLKTDCEGGEYDIFNDENFNFIKNNVKKISGEWHLNESHYPGVKEKFRKFRDTYLKKIENHQVFSVDGIDIKWDLWNDHFIEYYSEVIIYIDNRK
jgi:autotransporter strand-loop-strand O-heptosyltransferase